MAKLYSIIKITLGLIFLILFLEVRNTELCPVICIIHGFTILFRLSGFTEYSYEYLVGTDYRFYRIFGFYRLLKILFFSKIPTDFTDFTNIRFFYPDIWL